MHQDSYERDIPAPGSYNNRLNNGSYDRPSAPPGYSSNKDIYNDPRSYSKDSNYRQPDPQLQSRNEQPVYAHNQKNGSQNTHNNNDVYKQDMYSSKSGAEPVYAPSKPPRSNTSQRSPNQEDTMTVSAKYDCAYCSKELGK